MKKCKNCGKEIPEYKTFCCRSCSTTWNNKHRRVKWSTEKKVAFLERKKVAAGKQVWDYEKPQHCKYCGKLLDRTKGERRCCVECSKYIQLGLYKKLGLEQGSLKSRYIQAFEILWKAYFQDNLSVWAIFEKYRVCHTTLKHLFNENGVELRTISEGLKTGLVEGRVNLSSGDVRYRCGWHETWEGTKEYLRSSYEFDFAESLDLQKVPYKSEALRIPYFDSSRGVTRIAVPDFYLPETNEIVEVKSTWTYKEQEIRDKFRAYRELGYRPKLLLEHEELDI